MCRSVVQLCFNRSLSLLRIDPLVDDFISFWSGNSSVCILRHIKPRSSWRREREKLRDTEAKQKQRWRQQQQRELPAASSQLEDSLGVTQLHGVDVHES